MALGNFSFLSLLYRDKEINLEYSQKPFMKDASLILIGI